MSSTSGVVTAAPSAQVLGHPRGLATLFLLEMWERFSYYGTRALLVLFMTAAALHGGLGLSTEAAGAVYGLYTAGVYLCALPGGWVADRLLGQRQAAFAGGILIAAGNFIMALPGTLPLFYTGLTVIALGTGLLKPNASVMVGQLYRDDSSSRRDAGFSIFYLGINVGAAITPLVAGTIGERVGYRWGFACSGSAMLLGLALYRSTGRWLGDAGLPPRLEAAERRRAGLRLAGGLALLIVIGAGAAGGLWPMDVRLLARSAGMVMLLLAFGVFALTLTAARLSPAERRRVVVIALFFVASALFWAGYEQAGTTLNLFARDHTDRSLGGQFFAGGLHPVSWYQSVPPFFVLGLAPVFAWVWMRLGRQGRDPSAPLKLGLGLAQLGLSFLVMMLAARLVLASGHSVGPQWLILTYLLQTTGELCLSPIGLSNVSRLAPTRLAGQMMGTWFLGMALGNLVAGLIGGAIGDHITDMPAGFLQMALVGIGAGVLLAILARPVRRWMGGA